MFCYLTEYAQMIYTKQDSINNSFYGIRQEIGNSNLLIINNKSKVNSNGNFNHQTQLLKISDLGAIIDSIVIDTNFYTYGPLLVANNCYYLFGIKYLGSNLNAVTVMPTLIKYDINLNEVNRTYFNSYSSNVVSAIQNTVIKNNSIYIGFGANSKTLYYKLDSQLNKLDSAKLNGDGLLSMINYGNNLMVCGYGFDYPSSLGRLQVHELDTTFNLLSYFNMDSLTYITVTGGGSFPSCSAQIGVGSWRGNLLEITNNKYLVSGYYDVVYNSSCQKDDQNITSIIKNNSHIVKTNILGKQNVVHEASSYFSNTAKKYNYLYTVSKSGANLSNPLSPQNVLTEIMVTKLDTSGNIIWNNFYNTPNFYYDPYSICGTSDSGVVVCGVRYNISTPAINGVCEGFVMKIDKNGNQVFTGINDKEITNANTFNLFPNPTINEAYIQFPHLENELEINIKVIDMLGKLLYLTTNTINDGTEKITLDTRLFGNGLYNVIISSNQGSVTKKLSVIK
jgi:hypothetical protein